MENYKPLVAVIGRPNVGKSTFFNKICGKRISIVKDTPGVTRDRIYADSSWCNRDFTLIDTGGIDYGESELNDEVRKQAYLAIDLADVIVFFVDGRQGVTSLDIEIANYLRKTKKRIILAVNKLDNFEVELTYDFYRLSIGEPIPVSCEQSKGLGDLLDIIVEGFPINNTEKDENVKAPLKVAIVGRPNVGKSSLVNYLAGSERTIVSPIAGTTRDAIDTPVSTPEGDYILIDTAGLRRQRSVELDSVEGYSVLRSLTAIRRADVVMIVLDSSEEISEQDVRIAGIAHEEGKPSIIVMNKWDKVEKDTFTADAITSKLKSDLAFMSYFETVFISAVSGQRVNKLYPLINKVYTNASKRITTGTINDVVSDAVTVTPPPSSSGRRLKILYVTQPSVCPPKFVFFVNDSELVHFSYKRYLENSIRAAFDFSGTPINLSFVSRNEKE